MRLALTDTVMNPTRLYRDMSQRLATSFAGLPDKPEETADVTLRALWFAAAGQPRSAASSQNRSLPELGLESGARLKDLVDQRLSGVPLAHLTGRQRFMGLEFLAGPEALVPRRQTEILGRATLRKLKALVADRGRVGILDLCTGSGNLAVALTRFEPACDALASDLSADAIRLAYRNAARHRVGQRVRFFQGDLFSAFLDGSLHGQLDMVVCNPPYLSSAKVKSLPSEVSLYEPPIALDGGAFGMDILARLVKEAPEYLKPDSWLGFEVGRGQGAYLAACLRNKAPYVVVEEYSDQTGEVRAVLART